MKRKKLKPYLIIIHKSIHSPHTLLYAKVYAKDLDSAKQIAEENLSRLSTTPQTYYTVKELNTISRWYHC